ncbi:hypothetical protein EON63_25280 [archaeon]|nr:MAG: hypothetical protein EON63_25280 [archaeon]
MYVIPYKSQFASISRGLTLKVSGFAEKLPVLLDQLTSLLTNQSFWHKEIVANEQLYKICLDRVTRSLQSCELL